MTNVSNNNHINVHCIIVQFVAAWLHYDYFHPQRKIEVMFIDTIYNEEPELQNQIREVLEAIRPDTFEPECFFKNLEEVLGQINKYFFSHARTALKYGLKHLDLKAGDGILLPEYICDVITHPLQELKLVQQF